MSLYYKYNFISPEVVFATVKEELKSYFDTGIIDDLLFPRYTEYCLRKLGRATYKIKEIPLEVNNYEVCLPDNFFAVRELWGCTNVTKFAGWNPSAVYEQVTTQVTPVLDGCQDCQLKDVKVTLKTTGTVNLTYTYSVLLRPGNINALNNCSSDCSNIHSSSTDSFDIRDGKIVVNFPNGILHLVYYAIERDESENQLIPDCIEFTDWLEHYIKFKCFEVISNSVTDETYNQVQNKLMYYKQEQSIKYVIAKTELRLQSIYDVTRSIVNQKNRFNTYNRMMGLTSKGHVRSSGRYYR